MGAHKTMSSYRHLCVDIRSTADRMLSLSACVSQWPQSAKLRCGKLPAVLAHLFLCCLLFSLPTTQAQQTKPSEYQVKAAYLYNFGRFVDWPPNVTANEVNTFPICVLGPDPFGPALDATLANQTMNGKGVVARRISKPQDALNCRIAFVSSLENHQLKGILATLGKAGVLTVSDAPQFLEQGGMIQFVLDGNRIRFAVNVANAQSAGLTLSSELLKLAVTVTRNPQPGV
jgi:hypothetical protein